MAGFSGFPKDTISFLSDLRANNTRDWFQANKERYEAAYQAPAEAFCAAVAFRLQAETDDLHTAKIFRIHRDIRFSKDKTPYKPHLHILFRREGSRANLFFGLQTDGLVFGGGVMRFDKGQLHAYREAVDGPHGEKLDQILSAHIKAGGRLNDPPLKRVPKPYDGDHPRGALLRRKGCAIWNDIADIPSIHDEDFADTCIAQFRQFDELCRWFDRHLPPASG